MDWRMEENIVKGISDIVSNLKKQHAEEINLLNHQHKEVIQELISQSQSESKKHSEAMEEARKQVKYARLGFYVAIAAFIVTLFFNVYMVRISKKDNNINKDKTSVSIIENPSTNQTYISPK